MCDPMTIWNIVSLAHKEGGECSTEWWDAMEGLRSVSYCLCLRDVLKPPKAWLGLWRKRSICCLRTRNSCCAVWNYQLTNLEVCLGTMWFIVKFHYNFAKS